MKKKIIITGGLGYIGTELCKLYSGVSWHHQIIVIDNRFISERVNQIRNWNMEFEQGDILDKELNYGYNLDTFNRLKIVVQFKLIDGENEQKFDEIYLSSGNNDIKNESGIKVDQPGKVEEKIVELINNCNVSKQRYLVINIHLKFENI